MRRRLLSGVLLLLTGCGVTSGVDTFGPDFTGMTTVRMRGNLLPTPASGFGGIELNAEALQRTGEPSLYALLVEVRAEGLRIRPGESLRLVLDGDTVLLRRDTVEATWSRLDPLIREQARYTVTDSLLRRLPATSDARMAVRGAAWWEERRLSAENLGMLRDFVTAHVPRDTTGAPAPAAPPGP